MLIEDFDAGREHPNKYTDVSRDPLKAYYNMDKLIVGPVSRIWQDIFFK